MGGDMEQINCYAFINLGVALQNCYNYAPLQLKLWSQSPLKARQALIAMLRGEVKFKLDESQNAAVELAAILNEIMVAHAMNPEGTLTEGQVSRFNSALYTFDQAIQLELGRSPIFYVTPKGVFDTRALIGRASAVYEGYTDRLPAETIADTDQAGRCLAFTLPTAAGFHIARATEAVIRQYMTAYGCPPPKESQRNWGRYAEALKARGADAKIVHHLDQLRDLHRNPLVHPEVTLTMQEALSLWGMCVSLIQAMTAEAESKRASPSSDVAEMVPTEGS